MPFLWATILAASLRSYGSRYKTVGRHRRTPASAERIGAVTSPGSCTSPALAGLKPADTSGVAASTPAPEVSVQPIPGSDE